jgi:hypothetical protein
VDFPPFWQPRNQPSAGKCVGACDLERAPSSSGRGRCYCAGKGVKAVPDDRKQSLARARERERPRTTPEQWLSADIFEQPDLMADGRRRHTELGRGRLEAHVPGGSFECAKGSKGRKLSHSNSLDEFSSSSD